MACNCGCGASNNCANAYFGDSLVERIRTEPGPQGSKGDKGDTGSAGNDGTNGTNGAPATIAFAPDTYLPFSITETTPSPNYAFSLTADRVDDWVVASPLAGLSVDPALINAELNTGSEGDYRGLSYRKMKKYASASASVVKNMVQLDGVVSYGYSGTTLGPTSVGLFTLPAGYRPAKRVDYVSTLKGSLLGSNTTKFVHVDIQTNGIVTMHVPGGNYPDDNSDWGGAFLYIGLQFEVSA